MIALLRHELLRVYFCDGCFSAIHAAEKFGLLSLNCFILLMIADLL